VDPVIFLAKELCSKLTPSIAEGGYIWWCPPPLGGGKRLPTKMRILHYPTTSTKTTKATFVYQVLMAWNHSN